MASSDWVTLAHTNVSYSLVDTLGLDMDQNYCWNVRTSTASTSSPATFVTYNTTIGPHANTDTTPKSNIKLRALMRKNANEAVPFLFLRASAAVTNPVTPPLSNAQCYKLALRSSGNFALYKESIDGNFSSTPILVSNSTYQNNTTHHVEFSVYSQTNGDTFIEAYYGDRSSYESWTPIFKTMIFYSDNPIYYGYCGFGHYSTATGANSYFDLFEAYEERTQ
jgi:hypothetical protein